MLEHHLDITTPDGEMPTFVCHPDEGGPHPLVVFYMDAPGKREELHQMARRIAATGYFVMLPQLYYRRVRDFNVFESGDREVMFEHMNSLSNAMAVADAETCIAFADETEAASTARVGVVGYCMSGPFALALAAARPGQVQAAASFHGVRLVTDADDSPHRHLGDGTAELYVGAAETDDYAPPEMIEEFEAALAASGATGRVEWYPGTEHGFVFPERPLYHQPSAERHWVRLHALFDRTLR